MKWKDRLLSGIIVIISVLGTLSACDKIPANEGTLTIQLEGPAQKKYAYHIYPMGAGGEIPRTLETNSMLLTTEIAKATIEEGRTTATFTLNVGNYYVYREAADRGDNWRGVQIQRGKETIVTYPAW